MYAYYCLHKFHWRPSEYDALPLKEKALIIAMIDERIKQEKKTQNSISRLRRR